MAAVHPQHPDAVVLDDQLYRLIAETIPHLVWATAADGAADYFNSRLLAYAGLSAGQMAGQGWREIIHPDDRQRVSRAWNAASHTGEQYTIECRLRRADAEHRWHHVSALPLRDADGRILRWFGTCTDIDAEVRGAQILESMVEERTAALHEAQARLRALIDTEPECV